MFCSLVFCLAMIGQADGGNKSDRTVFSLYETQKASAGHDAAAQIRLALWCEEHGLTAERLKHLALAIARDPANTLARGLMGMVLYNGKWKRPEEVQQAAQADPAVKKLLAEYYERRVKTPLRADAQAKLAQWCHQNGLEEQARAHYSEVVRLDPTRDSAWKHLGYKKHGSRWVKPEELAAQKLEAERQKHADLRWKPKLEKIREELESSSPSRREKGRDGLAEINDPRAVPMICQILASGGETAQLAAVTALGQIDGPSASSSLASLAVFSESKAVRTAASEKLMRRDPRDVIGRLINLIRRPYKYTVRQGNGPGTTGELIVDGETFNFQRLYQYSSVDVRTIPFVPFPSGAPMVGMSTSAALRNETGPRAAQARQSLANAAAFMAFEGSMMAYNAAQNEQMLSQAMIENTRRNQAIQQTLADDIEMVEAVNKELNQLNDRVLPVLKSLTGMELGAEPDAWKKWWTDQQGYVYQSSQQTEKPTYSDTVSLPDVSLVLPQMQFQAPRTHSACFAAGTLVHTLDGTKPIESIQIGDRVLSQDPSTGVLSYKGVLATHKNQPAETLELSFNGEPLVATGIHRFWKVGKGWTMARDLKAGDRLRMIGGSVTVDAIKPDETQPVYNLDVADNRDFFVGNTGLLVHDFSFVQPVPAPFDHVTMASEKAESSSATR
jgi:hypothetical protein